MEKTLTNYSAYLKKIGNNHNLLSELDRELTGNLVFLYENQVKRIKLEKANFWKKTKLDSETKISDTMVEALWDITPEGQDEIKLKYTILGYEALLKSIKNSLISATVELKHLS